MDGNRAVFSEITDDMLVAELKKRSYRISKITDAAIEIPTSAGVIKAYESTDPGQPGICVMFQPAGYDCEVDASYVSVYEDEEYKTKDNERPIDLCILS